MTLSPPLSYWLTLLQTYWPPCYTLNLQTQPCPRTFAHAFPSVWLQMPTSALPSSFRALLKFNQPKKVFPTPPYNEIIFITLLSRLILFFFIEHITSWHHLLLCLFISCLSPYPKMWAPGNTLILFITLPSSLGPVLGTPNRCSIICVQWINKSGVMERREANISWKGFPALLQVEKTVLQKSPR